ncbi:deoxyuridine 5'-triphosphate nucleotidohydrolase [Candidatus Woesearchaeota archaeon CG1_02_33_12]|nr:MAG: deoxyuridine 5'-triphosphate nucleotidohydrolase [Candidatus Woesearchaeota archaeon CG1_02_33_12]PIN79133.1 MAG: dUTP diphosphatase [Candidatus Woesearchaeota archaeon CG10_big_fil_rev_8_21_14_0_10_33_12]
MIKINKIKENAILPHYAHEGDAGVDLYSAENYVLRPGQITLVSTGIKLAIPKGYEAQIRPKSGLALNHGISVCNSPGTIDSGYRGEIGVIAINHSKEEFKIEKGTKIAQMVFNKIEKAEFEEVKDLDNTKRGQNGFGSTGLN